MGRYLSQSRNTHLSKVYMHNILSIIHVTKFLLFICGLYALWQRFLSRYIFLISYFCFPGETLVKPVFISCMINPNLNQYNVTKMSILKLETAFFCMSCTEWWIGFIHFHVFQKVNNTFLKPVLAQQSSEACIFRRAKPCFTSGFFQCIWCLSQSVVPLHTPPPKTVARCKLFGHRVVQSTDRQT